MAKAATVAVEATEERYRALKHHPSGTPFEADGTARWPADQFTFRLKEEGAIRLLEDLHDPGTPAAAPQAPTAPAAAAPAAAAPASSPAASAASAAPASAAAPATATKV